MKIKIIKGVYGHVQNGIPTPKSKHSEPFEVSDEKAKELIYAGIAEKASELKSEADKPIRYRESLAPKKNEIKKSEEVKNSEIDSQNADIGSNDNSAGEEEKIEEYSMKNTKDELLKIAEDLGIEIEDPENTTKQRIIDILDEASSDDAPKIGSDEGIVG